MTLVHFTHVFYLILTEVKSLKDLVIQIKLIKLLFTAVYGISPLIGEKRKNLEKLQFQQDNLTFRNLHLMMIDFRTSAHTDKLAIYLVVKQ